jgi:peptidoglycan/LPS O-acetylase OafA/YrhL
MTQPDAVTRFDQQQKSRAIDALRGYAILLVIGLHVIGHVSALAWPAKRLLLLGYSGVQLFFIASSVTLLMSWSRGYEQPLGIRIGQFFTHRFFRIAPLYFLAIPYYWFFEGMAPVDFKIERLFATLLFVNAWTPDLLPTTGGWKPVPGGWSISVEFMFYLLFPLLALTVTTMRRAMGFVLVAYGIMLVAAASGPALYANIDAAARQNFLFFWPPNQLIVFSIGFLLYRCIKSEGIRDRIERSRINANGATALLVAGLMVIQFYDAAVFPRLAVLFPQHMLLTILFAGWALFMILKPTALAASGAVVNVGKMSFSIYLIHFAALSVAGGLLARVWPFSTEGAASIVYACILLVMASVISYQLARLTYRFVEAPFIRYGKSCHAFPRAATSSV